VNLFIRLFTHESQVVIQQKHGESMLKFLARLLFPLGTKPAVIPAHPAALAQAGANG
jgi:hypothetical protein